MNINDLVVPMILDPLQEERVTVTGRVLNIPESLQTVGVKTDNKVERIYFEFDRYFDGFNDFSEFNFYINYINANGDGDVYYCDDLTVEDDSVVFSWLTDNKLYALNGTAQFTVRAMHSDGRKWNTTIAQLTILDGLETQEAVVEQDYDFINQQFEIIRQHTEKLNALIKQVKTNTTNLDKAINTMGQADWNGNQVRFTDGLGNYGQYHDVSGEFISRDEIYLGYSISQDKVYSGHAGNYGIDIAKIDGNYTQETTNGFQLFDASKLPTKSQGGATVTNNGDGSFTISGSGNMSENIYLNYTIMHDEIVKMFKVGKVHVKLEKPTNPYFYVNVYKNNVFHKTLFSTIASTQLNSDILAEYINDNSYKFLLGFGGATGSAIRAGTIKPMLYQDGDGTWEPFSGGEPSPNPDYKQDMKCVDVSEIVSSGKNLVNADEYYGDYKSEDGYMVNNVVLNNTRIYFPKSFIGKTLTFSVYVKNVTGVTAVYLISVINGISISGNIRVTDTNNYTRLEMTITPTSDKDNIRISYGAGSGIIPVKNVMLNFGDTPQPYEPYQGSTTPFPLLLRALPDGTKDTYENGVITRRVGVATISDIGREVVEASGKYYVVLNLPKKAKTYGGTNCMCNILQYATDNIESDLDFGYYQNEVNFVIFSKTKLTLEEFKTKFANMKIYYELATPTTEQLQLPTLPSYYPYTHVWYDSEVEPKLIEWHINNKINYLQKLIEEKATF